LKRVIGALETTATLRNGTMGKEAMRLYSSRLAKEPIEDVLLALEKLAEQPRKEYEQAIPDLGNLLLLVDHCTTARRYHEDAKKNQRLVGWMCPDCGVLMSGFVARGSDLSRRCQGIPKDKRTDTNAQGRRICGAEMRVFYDEANEVSQDELLPLPSRMQPKGPVSVSAQQNLEGIA
jgi:hypothetical protein